MKKSSTANYLLFLGSLAFCWIAAEFALWYINPQIGTFPRKGHPYCLDYSDYLPFTTPKSLDFHHISDDKEFDVHYFFNAFGYRGPYPVSIQKKRKRILLLGDSYTLGWGSNWKECLAGLLQINFDSLDIEVIDAGYKASCSPDTYYAFMEKEGWKLKPDLVCLFLYSGNDMRDMQNHIWHETDALGAPKKIETIRFYDDYLGDVMRVKHGEVPFTYKLPLLNRSRIIIGLSNLNMPKDASQEDSKFKLIRSLSALQKRSTEHQCKLMSFTIAPKSYYVAGKDKEDKEILLFDSACRLAKLKNYSLLSGIDSSDYFVIDKHYNRSGNRKAFEKVWPLVKNEMGLTEKNQ